MMILRRCDGCWFIIVALFVSLYHSLGYGPSIHSRWSQSIHNTGYYRSINILGLSSSSVSIQQRSASSALFSIHAPKSKQIILFTPNNLRVHDNPCFNHISQLINGRSRPNTDDVVQEWNDDRYLLLLNDPDIEVEQSCVRAFRRNVRRRLNTSVHVLDGDLIEAFDSFHHRLCNVGDGSGVDAISIVTTEVLIEPNKSKYEELFKHISMKGMRLQLLKDCSLLNDDDDVISDNYRDHSQKYQSKRDIIQPIMDYSLVFPANHEVQSLQQPEAIVDSYFTGSNNIINDDDDDDDDDVSIVEGEDLAIALVSDYLTLGDDQFIRRYQDRYIDTIASSAVSSNEHRLSLCRLRDTTLFGTDMGGTAVRRGVVITSRYSSFFQGEVLSGLLSPLLSHGCISPRLLYHCRQVLFPGLKGLRLDRPLTCRVREEAIRRDWHHQLVRWNLKKKRSLINPVGYKDRKEWVIKYTSWRGYVQREATMLGSNGMDTSDTGEDRTSSPTAHQTLKPILLLIHGFGGSINQYTGLARQLCDTFDVYALDSLGFGQTEKPPLSYNQYLWRDQLLEYLERIVHGRRRVSGTQEDSFHDDDDDDDDNSDGCSKAAVFIAGNSIGGFFASSLAASIRSSSIMRCDGLILFNPSGDVLGVDVDVSDVSSVVVAGTPSSSSSSTTTIALEADYSPYKGPSSELLRLFGKLIFSLLQPRIAATCQWLYPSNKQHVITSGLADNIYRDSCDPGAADVIASGGKLPTPLTINDFFRIYEGPVLLAQGALDPLNNATQRAISFGAIRGNVSVDLLPLGHCPMDENPTLVASSIVRWMNAMKGGSE